MHSKLDINKIEKSFFKGGNPLKKLSKEVLDLFKAQQVGILYGTNASYGRFLPTDEWDRGVGDIFDAPGVRGKILKYFGKYIVSWKQLSPVFFYKLDESGQTVDNDGVISYMLRNCADYYKKGVSIIFSPDTRIDTSSTDSPYADIPFYSYDGTFIDEPDIQVKVDLRIIKHFYSENYISIYIPDYGILVVNTADPFLMERVEGRFVREKELKLVFDDLINLVELASLVTLGRLKGKRGSLLLWKKEKQLRSTSRALVENEKQYRDLYENAPVAYFSLDSQWMITKCNNKTLSLSGYSEAELLGRNILEFSAPGPGQKKALGKINELIEQDFPAKDVEIKFVNKNSQEVWLSLSFELIRDSKEEIAEIRVMAVDISERKALEKQLLQAQKMEAIGTLAGGIAHDFNNILSPISGYSELLLMEADDGNPREKEHLNIIHDCALYAKGLVNKMLTFSKQKESEFKLLQPHTFVNDALSLAKSFLPATIKIKEDVKDDCDFLMVDPVQAHQVIMNLISNAYHAMEESGGELSVTLDQIEVKASDRLFPLIPGQFIYLKISDTGSGIPAQDLERIFDPFFTTKKEGKGSGIGLSVVHGIIQTHKGLIKVESEQGQGTCFEIYLPAHEGEKVTDEKKEKELVVQTGSERILLVDDDDKVAMMTKHMLEKLGYQVTCHLESPKALEEFEKDINAFDLVLTDLTMPDISGDQLAEKITSMRRDIPVIMCTGFGENIDRNCRSMRGITGFLNKPVALRDLSVLLREILDKNQTRVM